MTNQKDRKLYKIGDNKEKELPEPIHSWLGQFDEEDDFLCGKVSGSLPEFTEEE
jgi:hypothetical protein